MRSLEDLTTIEELNKWASGRDLMNDDMLNLRRLQLWPTLLLIKEKLTGIMFVMHVGNVSPRKLIFYAIRGLFIRTRNSISVQYVSQSSTDLTHSRDIVKFIQGRGNVL